ncbi:choice-of-anchor tandem repeat GloVer-containing protein [Dyadobacter jiangsuensis]|uniref:Putative secreted protein (Por secretion system target) n=1 Tax=Dyadobacter jiangsuensis TaxID=1591085 RepID=A0A2P8G070_9BACT|nr:choice-of-anchor tandem repeat GloVer-containing protein [Dyadobacter jiangsuensis]PSL27366.1 putative secreted protein (Por secretion system target) [Dyadobacter jiangsuensis]
MRQSFRIAPILFLFLLLSPAAWSQGIYRFWGMTSEQGNFYKGSIFSANFRGMNIRQEYGFDLARPGENGCHDFFEYNGELYATAWQGNWGALIKWNPVTNVFTKLHDFDASCYGPEGNLYFRNGKLYGLTMFGGVKDSGMIYELDLATGSFTKKKDLGTLLQGSYPSGHALSFMNGKFYGVVMDVIQNAEKTVFFEWDPATNNFTKTLLIPDGNKPGAYRAMVPYNNKLYGIGASIANGNGVLFEWDVAANTYTIKKQFTQGLNGYTPLFELTLKGDKFYGSTCRGGANNSGVLFEWDPANNVYTKKIDLPAYKNQSDGLNAPHMTLLNDKLYSVGIGGPNGEGYIYEWEPVSNAFNIRYNFDPQGGRIPYSRLVYINGKFYSSTYAGGKLAGGIMYSWDPVTGDFDKYFDFNVSNGTLALGSLTQKGEKLYGMTSKGGSEGLGVLFEFDMNTKTYKRLQDLDSAKGINPEGNLTLKDGKFYGVTKKGGANDLGTLFEWDPDNNVFIKRHDFTGADGASPTGSLTLENGKLYGMTQYGGANNFGVIFEWNPDQNIYTKHIDLSESEGALPHGDMVFRNGKFYGMTFAGGGSNDGVIFEWEPATNIYTKKIDFDSNKGTKPFGGLTWWKDSFCGLTSAGGSMNWGTFFAWDPATNAFTKKCDMPSYSDVSMSTPVTNYGNLYTLISNGGSHFGGAIVVWNEASKSFQAAGSFNSETGQKPVYTMLTLVKSPAAISNGTPGGCAPGLTLADSTDAPHTWRPVIDDNGDIIAELNGNENAIVNIYASVHVHNGGALQDQNGQLYLGRNLTMSWTNSNTVPNAPTSARFYVKKEEVEALIAANNAKPGNPPMTSAADMTVFQNHAAACTTRIGATAHPIVSTVEPYEGGYVFTFDAETGSTFYIASKNTVALPVRLADFSARLEGNNGLLSWETTEESHFSHFEIQRGTDGKNFAAIGRVQGSTNSIGRQYTFIDKGLAALNGSSTYYRLKMTDLDQSFAYSKIVRLPLNGSGSALYPNPAHKTVRINLSWETSVTWQIIDTNGNAVSSGTAESGKFEVDVQSLKPGFYILKVNSDQLHDNFKLIKE